VREDAQDHVCDQGSDDQRECHGQTLLVGVRAYGGVVVTGVAWS